MPRPNKYETHVKPYLKEVREMALQMTERQIAQTLRVGYTSFIEYKKRYPELVEALGQGRRQLVYELKGKLIEKAKGFYYTEVTEKQERAIDTETGEMLDDLIDTETGEKLDNLIVTERKINKRYAAPDVAAINLLLKNYDPHWYNDPKDYELKKKALELQKEKIEQNEW